MRSAARITGVSFNTIAKLLVDVLVDAGNACAACADYHDKTVYNVTARRVQDANRGRC